MDAEPLRLARVGRGVVLIAASFLAIALGGVAYLRPTLSTSAPEPVLRHAPYHVTSVDFVTADVGWVVADFPNGDYAVLHTSDGGLTWVTQLAGGNGGHQQYLKFFDGAMGVFALVGTRPVLYRTTDGGRNWASIPALSNHSTVLSWSFVTADDGWMLADPATGSPPRLYRSDDGGWTWHDLGPPVAAPDQVFGARFSFVTTGWLATAGPAPDAFKTDDFGGTWTRVRLPVPEWTTNGGGRYFVDVHQTSGGGLIASVVYFPAYLGRSGSGGTIRQFPPLAVPFYDGSRPNNYIYSTMIDQVIGAPNSAVQAPQAELLRSVDNGATWVAIEPPALSGTLGYASRSTWWWIDAGKWSSSADGGQTWAQRAGAGLIATPQPGSLQVLDQQHAWFAAAGAPALEFTSNGGQLWRLVMLPAS